MCVCHAERSDGSARPNAARAAGQSRSADGAFDKARRVAAAESRSMRAWRGPQAKP